MPWGKRGSGQGVSKKGRAPVDCGVPKSRPVPYRSGACIPSIRLSLGPVSCFRILLSCPSLSVPSPEPRFRTAPLLGPKDKPKLFPWYLRPFTAGLPWSLQSFHTPPSSVTQFHLALQNPPTMTPDSARPCSASQPYDVPSMYNVQCIPPPNPVPAHSYASFKTTPVPCCYLWFSMVHQ